MQRLSGRIQKLRLSKSNRKNLSRSARTAHREADVWCMAFARICDGDSGREIKEARLFYQSQDDNLTGL